MLLARQSHEQPLELVEFDKQVALKALCQWHNAIVISINHIDTSDFSRVRQVYERISHQTNRTLLQGGKTSR